jgi:hypothetical protein
MSRDFSEAEELLRALVAEPGATARTRQNLALVLGLEGDDTGARRVSEADLNGAALDNNGRFYDYARARLTGQPLPSQPSAAAASNAVIEDEAPSRAARAVPDMPPPVLALKRTPRPSYTAAPAKPQAKPAIAQAPLAPPPTAAAATVVAASSGSAPAAPTQTAAVIPATAAPVRLVSPANPAAATQSVAALPKPSPVASSEVEP